MTDNDLIRKGLQPRWHGSYQRLMEWIQSPDSIARTHLQALKKNIQYFGNPPIHSLADQAHYLCANSSRFESGRVDFVEESERIMNKIAIISGNRKAMNLVREISQQYVLAHTSFGNQTFFSMMRGYVRKSTIQNM